MCNLKADSSYLRNMGEPYEGMVGQRNKEQESEPWCLGGGRGKGACAPWDRSSAL